jgi:hypothetical protein
MLRGLARTRQEPEPGSRRGMRPDSTAVLCRRQLSMNPFSHGPPGGDVGRLRADNADPFLYRLGDELWAVVGTDVPGTPRE